VAGQIAAQAPADGYTLLWSSPGALTINRILEKNLPYNADTAFTPIGRAFTFCNALIVRQDSPLTSVAQFIALAKEKSGQLQYGSQGIGSAGHLSAQMLQNMAGVAMSVVPYKGGTDILTAIISGEVPSAFLSSTAAGTMRGRVRISGRDQFEPRSQSARCAVDARGRCEKLRCIILVWFAGAGEHTNGYCESIE
jgi:tripartite-type tricarboxylate transporter receptor subunit TctC